MKFFFNYVFTKIKIINQAKRNTLDQNKHLSLDLTVTI